ncbi:MAG TPA: ATP-binding protein [Steroidobacteraceae bacterium]|nr:ATP-binding protein [Steroidobacteraceae bacterium]
MVYRRFVVGVVVQVVLIVLVCAVVAYLLTATNMRAPALLVILVLVAQVAGLLRFVQYTNRELTRFLEAVQHADLSQTFLAAASSGTFRHLAQSFESVAQHLRDQRAARLEESSYLNTLVHHVPIAIVAFDETGRIDLYNRAAHNLFGVSQPFRIDQLDMFGVEFPHALRVLEPDGEKLLKVLRAGEPLLLKLSAASLAMRGREIRIVSLQDIRRDVEVRELEAWQNLMRVLTHEIMNSVTPMSSLASTARDLLNDVHRDADSAGNIKDVHDALDTIAQRGSGLLHFVESYRKLTRLPTPTLHEVSSIELVSRVRQLLSNELRSKGIAFSDSVAVECETLTVDGAMVEQALINLVRNAVDALGSVEAGSIALVCDLDVSRRPFISVTDNGQGMSEEMLENIFVPFYTTKREGTGIGLNIVQQIMRAHQGSVAITSSPGQGTCVRLIF